MTDLFTSELIRRAQESEVTLADLYAQLESIQAHIRAEQDLLGHLRALMDGDSFRPAPKATGQQMRSDWSTATVPDAAARLLAEVGHPMHASEIQGELESRGMRFSEKDPRATVVTALVRGVRKGRFVRTAPNTFMLAPSRGKEGESD